MVVHKVIVQLALEDLEDLEEVHQVVQVHFLDQQVIPLLLVPHKVNLVVTDLVIQVELVVAELVELVHLE